MVVTLRTFLGAAIGLFLAVGLITTVEGSNHVVVA